MATDISWWFPDARYFYVTTCQYVFSEPGKDSDGNRYATKYGLGRVYKLKIIIFLIVFFNNFLFSFPERLSTVNGLSRVLKADIAASNGVVHMIDKLLLADRDLDLLSFVWPTARTQKSEYK